VGEQLVATAVQSGQRDDRLSRIELRQQVRRGKGRNVRAVRQELIGVSALLHGDILDPREPLQPQ
jgi:hypothetical protein